MNYLQKNTTYSRDSEMSYNAMYKINTHNLPRIKEAWAKELSEVFYF